MIDVLILFNNMELYALTQNICVIVQNLIFIYQIIPKSNNNKKSIFITYY